MGRTRGKKLVPALVASVMLSAGVGCATDQTIYLKKSDGVRVCTTLKFNDIPAVAPGAPGAYPNTIYGYTDNSACNPVRVNCPIAGERFPNVSDTDYAVTHELETTNGCNGTDGAPAYNDVLVTTYLAYSNAEDPTYQTWASNGHALTLTEEGNWSTQPF